MFKARILPTQFQTEAGLAAMDGRVFWKTGSWLAVPLHLTGKERGTLPTVSILHPSPFE